MKIYARAAKDHPIAHLALGEALSHAAQMHVRGFLPADATVWFNADYPELGMWVLGEKSTHVIFHRSVHAGWVRLNRTCAKIARTAELAKNAPEAQYNISSVPGYDDVHSTIVLASADGNKPVGIIANSNVVNYSGGTYTFDPFTVVDLNRYTAPENATKNPVQVAHAMLNGVALLTYGYGDEQKKFVENNVELYEFDFDNKHIEFFRQLTVAGTDHARRISEKIITKITAATQKRAAEPIRR